MDSFCGADRPVDVFRAWNVECRDERYGQQAEHSRDSPQVRSPEAMVREPHSGRMTPDDIYRQLPNVYCNRRECDRQNARRSTDEADMRQLAVQCREPRSGQPRNGIVHLWLNFSNGPVGTSFWRADAVGMPTTSVAGCFGLWPRRTEDRACHDTRWPPRQLYAPLPIIVWSEKRACYRLKRRTGGHEYLRPYCES